MNRARREREVKTRREERGSKGGTWEPRENHIAVMAELYRKEKQREGRQKLRDWKGLG